jgi:hypothetical protein
MLTPADMAQRDGEADRAGIQADITVMLLSLIACLANLGTDRA